MKALVTVDGSELSDRIIPVAQRLCELVPTAEIHLLTVLEPGDAPGRLSQPLGEAMGTDMGGTVMPVPVPRTVETHGEAMDRVRAEAEDRLKSVAVAFAGRPTAVHVRWARHPADEIIAAARELNADLVVMATHGRSGISHLLAGSVAEAVIRRSGRPVLVFCPER